MTPIPLGILDFPTGAAGAYDLLETQLLSTSALSVTFTGLGSYSDYKHLQIRATLRTDLASGFNGLLRVRANGDVLSNYNSHQLWGDGSSVQSSTTGTGGFAQIGQTPINGDGANQFGATVIDVLDFSNLSKYTTFRALTGHAADTTTKTIFLSSGLWMNTNAVTSLTIYDGRGNDWVTGCRFSLYGVR